MTPERLKEAEELASFLIEGNRTKQFMLELLAEVARLKTDYDALTKQKAEFFETFEQQRREIERLKAELAGFRGQLESALLQRESAREALQRVVEFLGPKEWDHEIWPEAKYIHDLAEKALGAPREAIEP